MNYKEIITENSEWVKEINKASCIECCFSCVYRKLRNPLNKNRLMTCGQLRLKFSSFGQSCPNFKHYELQSNSS